MKWNFFVRNVLISSKYNGGDVLLNGYSILFKNSLLETITEYYKTEDAEFIKLLDLHLNPFLEDEGAQQLCNVITTSKFCKLLKLNLSASAIGIKTVQTLGEYLSTPTCTLTELNLSDNPIGDEGVKLLCKYLAHNKSLRKLQIECEDIGISCFEHLLNNYNNTLSELNLKGNAGMQLQNFFENVENIVANQNRFEILDYISSDLSPAQVYKYIDNIYDITWNLRTYTIINIVPREVLVSNQILEYLQKLYIPPRITSPAAIENYLQSISELLEKLNCSIYAIPPQIISNYQLLEFLQITYRDNLLRSLHLTIADFPPEVSNDTEAIAFLQSIIQLMKKLNLRVADLASQHLSGSQLLVFVQSKYITQLLHDIKLSPNNLPVELSLSKKIVYLEKVSKILSLLKLQISDIPQQQISNCRILPYLKSVFFLLNDLNLKLKNIPRDVFTTHQLLEYLEVMEKMRDLEISEHQIPKKFFTYTEKLYYLNELKSGKQSTKKITIMVIGEEGVGKTALIQQLLGDTWVGDSFKGFDFKVVEKKKKEKKEKKEKHSFGSKKHSKHKEHKNESDDNSKGIGNVKQELKNSKDHSHLKKVKMVPRMGITDGIDIHIYKPEGKDFIMNIYDFGGQEIYYSTHQFVLSPYAIYILIFDASKSINANRIAYWIHNLSSIAPGSSVFIVGSHFDQPEAFENLHANEEQLFSIVDNIEFLHRDDHALHFITPATMSVTDPSFMTIQRNSSKPLLFWPISISPKSSERSPLVTTLIQSVTKYAESNMKTLILPTSWQLFRSVLFPNLLLSKSDIVKNQTNDSSLQILYDSQKKIDLSLIFDDCGEDRENEEMLRILKNRLYSEGSYKIGIMRESEIIKYGSMIGLQNNDVVEFLKVLEYWGEVIIIGSNIPEAKLVILKPGLLITLCKQFITSKKFSSSYANSVSYICKQSLLRGFRKWYDENWGKIEKEFQKRFESLEKRKENAKTTSESMRYEIENRVQIGYHNLLKKHLSHDCESQHILNLEDLKKTIDRILPRASSSSQELTMLVEDYIVPVLLELQLIYPFSAHPDSYIIPAMLRNPPVLIPILFMHNHPCMNERTLSNINDDIVIIERIYEFVYLPSGSFTRLMLEVWKHFSLIPEFASNLQQEDMFWEDGFMITDCSTFTNFLPLKDYLKHQICVVLGGNHSGNENAIFISITCPRSKASVIMPILHFAMMNVVIQPLEFTGKNVPKIGCAVTLIQNNQIISRNYDYSCCFLAISAREESNHKVIPPIVLLPYLIPEYYLSYCNPKPIITIDNNDSNGNIVADEKNQNQADSSMMSSSLETIVDNNRYHKDVKEIRNLGGGMGGSVKLGTWHSIDVAIKKANSDEIPALLNEIAILKTLHHPNVLKLFDVYRTTESDTPSASQPFSLITITELCKEGELTHAMKRNLHPILICCIVRDIAAGLSYLHNHSPPILHCDIRFANIFLRSLKLAKDEVCAVIGDFGFSRFADTKYRMAGAKSIADDVSKLCQIIVEFSFLLINNRAPDHVDDQQLKNRLNDSLDLRNWKNEEMIRDRVISKFEEIVTWMESMKFNLDTIIIADRMTYDLIEPFFLNSMNYKGDIQHDYEKKRIMITILLPSPYFPTFANLLRSEFCPENALPLLSQCIYELSVLPKSSNVVTNNDNNYNYVNKKFWKAICRYVIPLIGYAIDQNVCTLIHIEQLKNLGYIFHKLGDFDFGMTLFHHACQCADLSLVEALCPSPKAINTLTHFPISGSAAIHLAIRSFKQSSNLGGIKNTMDLIDFLISKGADINLQDKKGETALFKASMDGSIKLVIQLLNFSETDVHILSKEQISAVVVASRYSTRDHLLCIKALLQMGSEYSPSLRKTITNDELKLIRSVARDLINDANSAFARNSHSTLAIHSWLDN